MGDFINKTEKIENSLFYIGELVENTPEKAKECLVALSESEEIIQLRILSQSLGMNENDELLTCHCMFLLFKKGKMLTAEKYIELCHLLNISEISPLPKSLVWQGGEIALSPVCRDFLLRREPELLRGTRLVLPEKKKLYHNEEIYDDFRGFIDCYFEEEDGKTAALMLWGEAGNGKKFICESAATNVEFATFIMEKDCDYNLKEILNICTLYLAFPVLDDYDPLSEARLKELQEKLKIVFITAQQNHEVVGDYIIKRKIQPMSAAQRREMLNDSIKGISQTVIEKAEKLPLSISQIREAVAQIEAECLPPIKIPDEKLIDILTAQNAPDFTGNAEILKSNKTLADIVLPTEQTDTLRHICNFAKSREFIYSSWGFKDKIPYGRGITALFYGASGTGKTLAATAIANELNKPIYRVDLSGITSKYVGETQKNIAKIFDAAQKSDCILFFDEADALFGKRSDGADAQDKYANGDIAYLLQKTEQFDGITLLATNLLQNFDDAFRRRINFMIRFPLPDAGLRLKLWQGIFPKSAPISDIDFDFLSEEFELSGAGIKNCAINAAYLAATKGEDIMMEDIIKAIKWEYEKLGKIIDSNILRMYLG